MLFIMVENVPSFTAEFGSYPKSPVCVFRVNFERHFWIDTPMLSQVFLLKFWKWIEILFQVVDMAIVVEVISQLEKYAITKEALEVILFCILNLLYYSMKKII